MIADPALAVVQRPDTIRSSESLFGRRKIITVYPLRNTEKCPNFAVCSNAIT